MTHSKRVATERVQYNLARPHRVPEAKTGLPMQAWQDAWIATGLAEEATAKQTSVL